MALAQASSPHHLESRDHLEAHNQLWTHCSISKRGAPRMALERERGVGERLMDMGEPHASVGVLLVLEGAMALTSSVGGPTSCPLYFCVTS